jgi:hypothetical protein
MAIVEGIENGKVVSLAIMRGAGMGAVSAQGTPDFPASLACVKPELSAAVASDPPVAFTWRTASADPRFRN